MEQIIENMIESAGKHRDYEMAEMVYNLINELAGTFNCPSNWRDIGEKMAEKYLGDDWIMENCKLYEYYCG